MQLPFVLHDCCRKKECAQSVCDENYECQGTSMGGKSMTNFTPTAHHVSCGPMYP